MGRNQGYLEQMCIIVLMEASIQSTVLQITAGFEVWVVQTVFQHVYIYDLIRAFLFIGSLCSDVEFSVETDYSQETRRSSAVQQDIKSEWSHAVEQTLTVFVFTQYTDPFRSQISDFLSESRLLFPII